MSNAKNLATFLQSGGSIAGDANFDSNTLFVDASANAVGIGTNSPSTALDVTGTITSDGLTVENTGSPSTLTLTKTDGSAFTAIAGNYSILGTDDATNLYFKTNGSFRQNIASNGDISFYEDTGTTAKLFWDASTEALGIGTTSPSGQDISANNLVVEDSSGNGGITIKTPTTSYGSLHFSDGTGVSAYRGILSYNHSDDSMQFSTNSTTALTIDSSQRVGIGESDPQYQVQLSKGNAGGVGPVLYLKNDVDSASTGHAAEIRFNLRAAEATSRNALIKAEAEIGYGASPALTFHTSSGNTGEPEERMRIDSNGNAIFKRGSDVGNIIQVTGADTTTETLEVGITGGNVQFTATHASGGSNTCGMTFRTRGGGSTAERMRIDSSGNLLVGTTNNAVATQNSDEGANISNNGRIYATAPAHHDFNRTADGEIFRFRSAATTEGNISVSGSTVSYNGFTGTHWTRLSDNSKPTILRGTVLESIGTMMDWYQAEFDITTQDNDGNDVVTTHKVSCAKPANKNVGDTFDFVLAEDNDERLPAGTYSATLLQEDDIKHVKSKVSDTSESKAVYGVFSHWDSADGVNDMYVASVGTSVVRINSTETVAIGDLLDSNGDGTAKVQSDDIIRSRTIGKVLSTVKQETYSDGSYTVPCALYCA